jgi:hypothetical protein
VLLNTVLVGTEGLSDTWKNSRRRVLKLVCQVRERKGRIRGKAV